MARVLVNRRRLLVLDRFVLPDDTHRRLYEVTGHNDATGFILRPVAGGWYGYLHMESGVVTGSIGNGELKKLLTLPEAVLMRECDVR